MIYQLYTIKDKIADEYGPIFQAVNDGVAVRSTAQVIRDAPDPNDYELYCVGAFNSDTGAVAPEHVREIPFKLSQDRLYAITGGDNNG